MSSSIELLTNQNSFSLEFSTLRYSQTSSQSYVYRLKGLSDDWIVNTSGNNRATFFNVPPGEYLFEVAIQDSNELHIENVSQLEIIVQRPFYLTSTAYLLYCFVIVIITFIIIKYVRRKHQRELYEIERSKSLNYSQIKIDFLTNTSHELKTPLSLILGRLSMLIVSEKNPEKRQKLLSIQNSAEQIRNLTLKNLKSNLETQGLYSDLDLKPIEITNFTKTIHNSFEENLREKSIRFSFNEPSEPTYAMIDINLFWSVLENLLSNSIKFTPSGGSINMSINGNISTNNVSISVSDTGCGIDPLKLPYVFDRYYKTSFDSDGHGLGLAIARDIVTAHNGTISVISTLNSGSEFTVNLPLAERSTKNNTIAQKHKDTLANILVIEDNCEMLDFICEGLSENFNCNRASDGAQGFQIALEQRPALIITDLEMPNMTGFELTEKVRDNIFICHTPIIMLTAHSDKASEIESYSKGVDAYIRKPFDINDLTIRAWQLIKKSEIHKEKIRQQSLAHINEANIVSINDKFIETITGIIESRMSDNTLTVRSLSNDCAMSEKQIYRRLKQLTGLTPNEYVRQVRLNRAAMLLKQGGFSVSEVLFMVGFSNPSYFTKCFKTQFRVTPSEYMDAYKEKNSIFVGQFSDNDI